LVVLEHVLALARARASCTAEGEPVRALDGGAASTPRRTEASNEVTAARTPKPVP
jgi:hypothetical protein